MRRNSGSILILVLLLVSLIFVLGVAYLGKQSAQYKNVRASALAMEARELAFAGLEDTRVKMDKDLFFPLPSSQDQIRMGPSGNYVDFKIVEPVYDLDGVTVRGHYLVTINRNYAAPVGDVSTIDQNGAGIIVVTSVGFLGATLDQPRASYKLSYELDVQRTLRSGLPGTNPSYFEIRSFKDWGSL